MAEFSSRVRGVYSKGEMMKRSLRFYAEAMVSAYKEEIPLENVEIF